MLSTLNNLGILCEQVGGYDLLDEKNTRVLDAGKRLEDLHTDLDKDLRLNSPYPYSREHQFVCDFKSHNPELYDAYWYHPDHLGSSSFITNTTGEISQHFEYLPFGETLVEEHLNSYNSPFKFNGKEYDAETGNYYYGARYLNPKWSTFLTPDPALESYPGISPYAYTLNNPIRYVDPTGMFVEENPVYDSEGNHRGNTKEGFTGQLIIYNGNMDFSNMSKEELVDNGGKYYEYVRKGLEKESQSKVLSHVLNNYKLPNGVVLDNNEHFDIITGFERSEANASYHGVVNGKHQIQDNGFDYEYTVENIRAVLGLHEIYGHGMLNLRGGWTESHLKIHLLTLENAPKGVTNRWKENTLRNIIYTYYPARKIAAPREFYEKYLDVGGEKFW